MHIAYPIFKSLSLDYVDNLSDYVLYFDNNIMASGSKEDLSARMCELRILQNQLKLHKPLERIHNARYGVVSSSGIRILSKEQIDEEMKGKIKETFDTLIKESDGDIRWL